MFSGRLAVRPKRRHKSTSSGKIALKTLSDCRKRHQQCRQRREAKKQAKRTPRLTGKAETAAARNAFEQVRRKLNGHIYNLTVHPGFASFVPPALFHLHDNYEATLNFLTEFQYNFGLSKRYLCGDGIERPVYADFGAIEDISAGAGLVLAAEIHNYASALRQRPIIHDHKWHENVRAFFIDAGLFPLLNIDPHDIASKPPSGEERRTLQFRNGRSRSGADADGLIAGLKHVIGRDLGHRRVVYDAIAEALANVEHAYPYWFRRWPRASSTRWWASGFWAPGRQTVGIQLYDRGAGIPATLPRKPHYVRLRQIVDPERTAAGLIAAALEYGRTSTGQRGRGRGLAEMSNWIEKTNSGFLRILSGGGSVTFSPGKRIAKVNHNVPFPGTLVEWEVSLNA